MTASSMNTWQALTQPPGVVAFFKGLFDSVGVKIVETGESFTGRHLGDRIDFIPDINESGVDFTISVTLEQVDGLAASVTAGELGTLQEYRIVRTLFTPAAQATLRNPIMSSPILRKLNGVEDLIHVNLRAPSSEVQDASHTLIYAARQWIVVPGLLGKPRRIFELTMADALEYHRRAHDTIHKNTLGAWWSFGNWYRSWRKTVSRRV